jgi:hypothetical protein
VGDADDAHRHYERAAELAPGSVRNQYGLAVHWAREDESGRAREHFARVRALPCTQHSERLFCEWMKAEAGRVLGSLSAD